MTSKLLNIGSAQARWVIIFSYIIALAFDTMALLDNATSIIPPITLLVLLYWCANFLDKTHILSAFILGLLADSLYQTTLGAHALIFSFITFLMLRHRLRFKGYPLWQQAFFIGAYMMAYQVINYILFAPTLESNDLVQYWSMPAASILLWPLLSTLFRRITHNIGRG